MNQAEQILAREKDLVLSTEAMAKLCKRDHEIAREIAAQHGHDKPTLEDQLVGEVRAAHEVLYRASEILQHIHIGMICTLDMEPHFLGMLRYVGELIDIAQDMRDAAGKLYVYCGAEDKVEPISVELYEPYNEFAVKRFNNVKYALEYLDGELESETRGLNMWLNW